MQPTVTARSGSKRELGGVAGFRLLNSQKVAYIPDYDGKPFTVGRTPQCDIRVRHETVSRLHCLIHISTDDRYVIHDATKKKTNRLQIAERGRYSPFREVAWHVLDVGNYLRLGDVILVAIDANGHCPVTVGSAAELFRCGLEVYGSRRKLFDIFELPRTWPAANRGAQGMADK